MNEPSRHPKSVVAAIAAGTWRIDPSTSEIGLHTRSLGLIPVNVRFEKFSGEMRIDDVGVGSGQITIETASIKTGIKKRDAHLRTGDFFHTDEYPEATFVSDPTAFDRSSNVTGTLRIRDKAIAVDTPVTIEPAGANWRFIADFEVDHAAAGLGWARPGVTRKPMAAHVELTFVPIEP